MQWRLGTGFNLVTDETADPGLNDGNRRGFDICRGDKVVMMVFISQTEDDEAEDFLTDGARSHLGLTPGAKIYILSCQGVECSFTSVRTNGDVIDFDQEGAVLNTDSEESIEIIGEWLEYGITNGIVPPADEGWAWSDICQLFWNNEGRWAPRNGQEEVFHRRR